MTHKPPKVSKYAPFLSVRRTLSNGRSVGIWFYEQGGRHAVGFDWRGSGRGEELRAEEMEEAERVALEVLKENGYWNPETDEVVVEKWKGEVQKGYSIETMDRYLGGGEKPK